jgi:dolichyl-diphosphooligosaccharide---protein glycosyltransferase
VVKSDTTEKTEVKKEKVARRKQKKEKDLTENAPVKSIPAKKEKRPLMLPFEASFVSILLLIVLGGLYVVCNFLKIIIDIGSI